MKLFVVIAFVVGVASAAYQLPDEPNLSACINAQNLPYNQVLTQQNVYDIVNCYFVAKGYADANGNLQAALVSDLTARGDANAAANVASCVPAPDVTAPSALTCQSIANGNIDTCTQNTLASWGTASGIVAWVGNQINTVKATLQCTAAAKTEAQACVTNVDTTTSSGKNIYNFIQCYKKASGIDILG